MTSLRSLPYGAVDYIGKSVGGMGGKHDPMMGMTGEYTGAGAIDVDDGGTLGTLAG